MAHQRVSGTYPERIWMISRDPNGDLGIVGESSVVAICALLLQGHVWGISGLQLTSPDGKKRRKFLTVYEPNPIPLFCIMTCIVVQDMTGSDQMRYSIPGISAQRNRMGPGQNESLDHSISKNVGAWEQGEFTCRHLRACWRLLFVCVCQRMRSFM